MTTRSRLLFPDLPPELRNEIYNCLAVPKSNSTATNTGLPFQLKTYECKHTTVQICPVHFGSTGLLALQKYQFQEACEYYSWLLNNALELRIGITFKGRVNTFVQTDWNKKMEMHLRKLAKQHPWFKKIARYDIHILWAATDGPLKSRKNKKKAGQLPMEMMKTLTGLMEENVKRTRGEVNVQLCLGHSVVVENMISSTKFGLSDFLSVPPNLYGVRKLVKEIWKGPLLNTTQTVPCLPFVPAALGIREVMGLLEIEEGLVKWVACRGRLLVMRKTMVQGNALEVTIEGVRQENNQGVDYIILGLVKECLGQR
ncbi:Nn.00g033380.m01.CDS01 [Neocucurbitaria sp. VM-36]